MRGPEVDGLGVPPAELADPLPAPAQAASCTRRHGAGQTQKATSTDAEPTQHTRHHELQTLDLMDAAA
jgi:hypothetical protein